MGQWCPHCLKQGGCSIYDTRPEVCRTFNCEWLINPSIGDEWQPLRSKIFLMHIRDGDMNKLVVHVDSGSPLAWKNEPYYSQLKRWSRELLEIGGLVNIYVGKKVIVVLPDRDVDLGTFNLGDKYTLRKKRTALDWEYEVFKTSPNEPPK